MASIGISEYPPSPLILLLAAISFPMIIKLLGSLLRKLQKTISPLVNSSTAVVAHGK